MGFSCGRSAGDEGAQVFLPRSQGDADECSGHASHSPPQAFVLVLRNNGETEGGWEVNPDRPAKAAHTRESPSALALAVPARCRMTK